MRILGFSKKWQKLSNQTFTTFRFPRKDKDWQVGEVIQVVYKPRSPFFREILGTATIISKEQKLVFSGRDPIMAIGDRAAIEDGFANIAAFQVWMMEKYPLKQLQEEPINKLTLKWIRRTK